MKRLIVILMALALATAVFTACAGNTGNDSPADNGKPDITAGDPAGNSDSDSDEPAEPNKTDGETEADESEPTQPSDPSEEFLKTITPETATAKGVCGNDLTWYYKDSVLIIKGTGEMMKFVDENENVAAPWMTYNDGEIMDEIIWVIVDEGVTSIGAGAFMGLGFLSKAVLPDSLEVIGAGAFLGCSNLTAIAFPESLKEIGYCAFKECASLTSISFPESLEVIDDEAFYECVSLTSAVLPASLLRIGSLAFYQCGLTSIAIPAAIEELGEYAFSSNDSLTDITLSEGLTEINLYGLGNTKAIVIPASVTKINGFGYQQEITFLGDAPEIDTREVKNSAEEVIGRAIYGLPEGFKFDSETRSFINEPEETGVTIYYSGDGFEKYTEMCPQYNWVKK